MGTKAIPTMKTLHGFDSANTVRRGELPVNSSKKCGDVPAVLNSWMGTVHLMQVPPQSEQELTDLLIQVYELD